MKNVSSLKANDTNSPKTPGGISKSLLTPCRRLGLSRNWRKSGPSPFISPLASSSTDAVENKKVTSERKELSEDQTGVVEDEVSTEHNNHTPSRNIAEPRKKKSKTLLEAINKSQDQDLSEEKCTKQVIDGNSIDKCEVVSTPVRTKSKKSKKHPSPLKRKKSEDPSGSIAQNNKPQEPDVIDEKYTETVQISVENTLEVSSIIDENCTEKPDIVSTPVRNKSLKSNRHNSPLKDKDSKKLSKYEEEKCKDQNNIQDATYTIKEKSPNELRKECMVVIQRKIFKKLENIDDTKSKKNDKPAETVDSDSDEAPLISIQKKNSIQLNTIVIDDDDDFIENKTSKAKLPKPKALASPKNKVKELKLVKAKQVKAVIDHKPSQNSFDDDDDDDFDNKKTILIRKTYDKVIKPSKAKSTGSITQRDIDNLRHRIEAKKKLLLAQSLTPDTEELRSLIKKWQKGCQNALMELLDLMRNKMPDKANMDYSEMLQALKIPPSLVGYDSENDSFVSPDDAGIILGQFKDV